MEPAGEGTTVDSKQIFRKRSRKAMATICLSLSDSQLLLVNSAVIAREAWLESESHYKKNTS